MSVREPDVFVAMSGKSLEQEINRCEYLLMSFFPSQNKYVISTPTVILLTMLVTFASCLEQSKNKSDSTARGTTRLLAPRDPRM